MTKIAIIGAGLSGVTLANLLRDQEVTVFEKSRGVSGRMSTRRAEPFYFDHGAQYFTARTQEFQQFLQPLIDAKSVQRWNARHVTIDQQQIIERHDWGSDEARFVGVPGMNQVVKALAKELDIRLNTRIETLNRRGRWILRGEGKVQGEYDWVVTAIPAPQAQLLLPKDCQFQTQIQSEQMLSCYSLMLGFDRALKVPFDAAHVRNSDISWIGVNNTKPGRDHQASLVIHSSESYSRAHIDGDRDEVTQHLISEASAILNQDLSDGIFKAIHGWRYANNESRTPLQIMCDRKQQLGACGDWCQGGRVEGAYTSARQLAKTLRQFL